MVSKAVHATQTVDPSVADLVSELLTFEIEPGKGFDRVSVRAFRAKALAVIAELATVAAKRPALSAHELALVEAYRRLDADGCETVIRSLAGAERRMMRRSDLAPPIVSAVPAARAGAGAGAAAAAGAPLAAGAEAGAGAAAGAPLAARARAAAGAPLPPPLPIRQLPVALEAVPANGAVRGEVTTVAAVAAEVAETGSIDDSLDGAIDGCRAGSIDGVADGGSAAARWPKRPRQTSLPAPVLASAR